METCTFNFAGLNHDLLINCRNVVVELFLSL